MLEIHFLLDLAVILLSTKIFGLITRRVHMPQVVGALLAGLILGPAVFDIVHETDFIDKMARLGVIVLMFGAGMETDIKELKKCGRASLVIALLGVFVPLAGGFAIAAFYNGGSLINTDIKVLLQNLMLGIILTATSVSITVETLQELGKLRTPSGTAILGAAVIDDIIGIVLLSVITGMSSAQVSIGVVLIKIAVFFLMTLVLGVVFFHIFNIIGEHEGRKRRVALLGFVFCLVMAFVAENYFGVADIIGAYIAGIVISNTYQAEYIQERAGIVSYMLLSPIFFASIGIKTTLHGMDANIIGFTIVFTIFAILSKVVGCGLGAKICRYSSKESWRIGIGMISRGEVGLIVANIGVSMGLIKSTLLAPIIIVVVVTSLITPILLKMAYSDSSRSLNKTILQKSVS